MRSIISAGNPQTGVGTASSIEDVQPLEEQPPPDYDEVVGEGDASGGESVLIEPVAAEKSDLTL